MSRSAGWRKDERGERESAGPQEGPRVDPRPRGLLIEDVCSATTHSLIGEGTLLGLVASLFSRPPPARSGWFVVTGR
jgi:hypothetical protein